MPEADPRADRAADLRASYEAYGDWWYAEQLRHGLDMTRVDLLTAFRAGWAAARRTEETGG